MHPALRLFLYAFAGLTLFFAMLLAAVAQERTCRPVAVTQAMAQAAGASFVQVTEPQAILAYAALYNAQPPVSHETFTAVYLILLPGGTTVVALGNSDAVCAEMPVPSDLIQKLMDRVLGRAI